MSSKEIVLIHPPSPMLEQEKMVPPLGILYLAAVLENVGHHVKAIDVGNEKIDLKELTDTEFVGISTTTPQYPEALKILRAIKKQEKHFPIVAIGGSHASVMKEGILPDGWDFVCVGEGERIIINLVEGKFNEKLVIGERVQDLNSLPLPAHHLLDLRSYHRLTVTKPTAAVISSRGCPFKCVFCAKEISGKIVRYRSPEKFLEEIKTIKEKYGIDQFVFYDDIFTLNPERVKKICEGLRPLGVVWRCNSRVDTVNPKMLKRMKEAGCLEIAYGIESANNGILKYLSKGTTVEDNRRAIELTKNAGIRTKVFLLFGSALDSWETARKNVDFVKETNPDTAQLSVLVPIPGSEMYANPAKFDIKLDENDISSYYYIGKSGRAGDVIRSTKFLSPEEFKSALDMLYAFLEEWKIGKQETPI